MSEIISCGVSDRDGSEQAPGTKFLGVALAKTKKKHLALGVLGIPLTVQFSVFLPDGQGNGKKKKETS